MSADPARPPDPAGTGAPPARVEVRDLHFAYPDGRRVLVGVSLTAGPGDRIAVLGANGAGKSTLLLHLNGLLAPGRGHVIIDGLRVGADTAREVRRRVGLVFQDPDDQLFLPTLLEDVAFGPLNDGAPPAEAERRARDQLRALGLEAEAGRAAHHLSGGEKRLAALATALVGRPGVLVLDEPTAGLDARTRRHVLRTLRDRTETLVVATHDLDVARDLCTTVLLLDAGRTVAFGPAPEILGNDALLHRHGVS